MSSTVDVDEPQGFPDLSWIRPDLRAIPTDSSRPDWYADDCPLVFVVDDGTALGDWVLYAEDSASWVSLGDLR